MFLVEDCHGLEENPDTDDYDDSDSDRLDCVVWHRGRRGSNSRFTAPHQLFRLRFFWRNYWVNPLSTGHVWYTVLVGADGLLLYRIRLIIPDPGILLFPIGGLVYLASFARMFLVDGLEPKYKDVANQIIR